MGLRVSHGAWDGPYSAFHRFRVAIANAANIPLVIMDGYHDDAVQMLRAIGSTVADDLVRSVPIKWERLAPDPIHTLLNHSDCDGIIENWKLSELAFRLDELAAYMKATKVPHDLRDYGDIAATFAAGCRSAYAAGEHLAFS